MSFQKIEKTVKSSDKVHDLWGVVYVPDKEPLGLFQIVHGMIEHIGRYERFMSFLAEQGYVVFAHDHLGHGKSVKSEDEYGYIAHKKGWQRLVDDVALFAEDVRNEYGRSLPYILMGHSMGSFIARVVAEQYDAYDKLIIMGTGGPNPALMPGLAMIRLLKVFKGEKKYSDFIDNVAFGEYNDRFKEENDFKSWLSSIPEERDLNKNDPLCNFRFSLSGMDDLLMINKLSNRKEWASSLNKKKPVLLVSGSEDPVGDYGNGVMKVNEMLKKAGVNVNCIIYEGARHEILNDVCGKQVLDDILDFIK